MMNIILASDNNYVQHCAVTICSILEHNTDVVIYLLTESLSKDNINILERLIRSKGASFHLLTVPSSIVNRMPMPKEMSNHISIATYYRLFICDLVPQSIDKILYLDGDIVVRNSLEKLWNIDIGDFAIGAVYQYNEWCDNNQTWSRLNISPQYGYFNAGVLLINLQYWRNHNLPNTFMDYIKDNYYKIRFHDQDVLNAVLYKNVYPLGYEWNLLPFLFDDYLRWTFPYPSLLTDLPAIIKDPAIIHFVNTPKPWQCGCTNPFRKEYFKYLSYTPWKGFKPKFEFSKFFYNYIWHPLMVKLGKIRRKFLYH